MNPTDDQGSSDINVLTADSGGRGSEGQQTNSELPISEEKKQSVNTELPGVKNIEAPEVPQRSDRNKLNMQLVERMLNFVEARLESKLSGLEKLISRNVKN